MHRGKIDIEILTIDGIKKGNIDGIMGLKNIRKISSVLHKEPYVNVMGFASENVPTARRQRLTW